MGRVGTGAYEEVQAQTVRLRSYPHSELISSETSGRSANWGHDLEHWDMGIVLDPEVYSSAGLSKVADRTIPIIRESFGVGGLA
jgi:hypothetical protein